MSEDCDKSILGNGNCCRNCKSHIEDFYHCATKMDVQMYFGKEKFDHCICSKHKGWICYTSIDGEPPTAHSGWSLHGGCEMHIRK
jgi:hypothetical protein